MLISQCAPDQYFLDSNHIDACAAALPLSPGEASLRLGGEGWGGGKPHTPSPEASAVAEASVDEVADKVDSPRVALPPNPPPREREREREDNPRGWKR